MPIILNDDTFGFSENAWASRISYCGNYSYFILASKIGIRYSRLQLLHFVIDISRYFIDNNNAITQVFLNLSYNPDK